MNDPHDEPLSQAQRAALDSLPRERIPPAHLEERVVDALRREGLLQGAGPAGRSPGAVASGPVGTYRRFSGGWLAAAVAAGLTLFAAGTVTGQRMATRDTIAAMSAAMGDDPAARAARVQETGSAYVRAVAQLTARSADGAPASGSGLEAARVALHAAALELARANPDDATIRLVLSVLEERAQAAEGSDGNVRTTIWF